MNMNNAPTFLNEVQDPNWADLDVSALSSFSSPVLLTEGDQSPPWFPKIMSKLAGAIDGAERLTFSGAGHVPQLTHPDEYVRAVVEFIQARCRRGGLRVTLLASVAEDLSLPTAYCTDIGPRAGC